MKRRGAYPSLVGTLFFFILKDNGEAMVSSMSVEKAMTLLNKQSYLIS